MKIDPDVIVHDLVDNWINGNRVEVLDALENDHPGLTALFFVAGDLSYSDLRVVCNLLMDRRKAMVDRGE